MGRERTMLPQHYTTAEAPPEPDVSSTPVHYVWFQPEDLYQGDSFYTFVSGGPRTPFSGTWLDFTRWLSDSTEGDPSLHPDVAKRARGAWVPGRYTGTRGRKDLPREFLGTRVLVVDIDGGDPDEVADALLNYRAVVHSTYKHRVRCETNPRADPRCRAAILLGGECFSGRHYNIGEHAVADYLNGFGFRCPAGDSLLGKLAFLPMHQRGVKPVFICTSGKPLDLARLVRSDEERRRFNPVRQTTRSTGDHTGAIRWAADRVAAAPQGERHNTRRDAARWLSELGVDDATIRKACLDAHVDDNAARTVEWAIKKGREAQP